MILTGNLDFWGLDVKLFHGWFEGFLDGKVERGLDGDPNKVSLMQTLKMCLTGSLTDVCFPELRILTVAGVVDFCTRLCSI